MKAKPSWLLFAALLSTAVLPSAAAKADAPAGPMTPAVAVAPPVWAVAPCSVKLTSSTLSLPSGAPKPIRMDTLNCGSCSVPACRSVAYNSACGSPLRPSSCVTALGSDCDTGEPQCQC